MKIYLDDVRPTPTGWTPAKTAAEAIALLTAGPVEAISLDHDLGEPEAEVGTGYVVAVWLEDQAAHCAWSRVPASITIHSANPVGIRRMQAAIDAITRMRGAAAVVAAGSVATDPAPSSHGILPGPSP